MSRLVSILILEEGEYEVIQSEFIKWLERSGNFKVLQFNRTDLSNTREEEDEAA